MPNQEYATIDADFVTGVLADLRFELPEVVVPSVNVRSPTMKWRLTSAMQKTYRRNLPSFEMYMAGLLQIDPVYAWRRFPVVVMEESGPLVPLNAMTFCALQWLARSKKNRTEVGATSEDLIRFGRVFTAEARCRLAQDAAVVYQLAGLKIKPIIDTGDQMGSTVASYLGQLEKHPGLYPELLAYAGDAKNPVAATRAMLDAKGGYDPYLAWIAVEGVSQRHGGLFSIFPHIIKESDENTEQDEEVPEFKMIGAYPTFAFDMYTSDGKRALAYFMAMTKSPYVALMSDIFKGDKAKMLAATEEPLFFTEIGRLGKRLTRSDGALGAGRAYQRACLDVCAQKNGVPDHVAVPSITDALWHSIPDLNYARVKVVSP